MKKVRGARRRIAENRGQTTVLRFLVYRFMEE